MEKGGLMYVFFIFFPFHEIALLSSAAASPSSAASLES